MEEKITIQVRIILRSIVMIIAGIIAIVSFVMSLSSLGLFRPRRYQVMYSYQNQNKISYKVNLIENDFVPNDKLGENDSYIASLIDSIDIDFSHFYNGSKEKKYDLEYKIAARLEGLYNSAGDSNNSEVWSKDYVLSETKKIEDVLTTSTINESISLKFPLYVEEVNKFNANVKIPITATLNVYLDIIDKSEKYNYETESLKLIIPLDEEVFKISSDYVPARSDTEKKLLDSNYDVSILSIIIYSIIFICSFVVFIMSFFNLWKKIKKGDYAKTLAKLLKNYDSLIVDIEDDLDRKKYQVIKIRGFNELLDLEDELRIPILHYSKNETNSYFYIIKDKLLYVYEFNDTETVLNRYNR